MEHLSLCKEEISKILREVLLLGLSLQATSTKLEKQNAEDVDQNRLENIVLELTTLLGKCKGNICAITDKISHLVERTNGTLPGKLFKEIVDELNKYKPTNESLDYQIPAENPSQVSSSAETILNEWNCPNTSLAKDTKLEEPDDVFLDRSFVSNNLKKEFWDLTPPKPANITGLTARENNNNNNVKHETKEKEIKVSTGNFDSQETEIVGSNIVFTASETEIFINKLDSSTPSFEFSLEPNNTEQDVGAEENRPGSPWSHATEKLLDSDGEAECANDIGNIGDFEDEPMDAKRCIEENIVSVDISDSDETDIERQDWNQNVTVTAENDSKGIEETKNEAENAVATRKVSTDKPLADSDSDETQIIGCSSNTEELGNPSTVLSRDNPESIKKSPASEPNIDDSTESLISHLKSCDNTENEKTDITEELSRVLGELAETNSNPDETGGQINENELIDVSMVEILNSSFSDEETDRNKQDPVNDTDNETVPKTDHCLPNNIKQEPKDYEEQDEPEISPDQLINELEEMSDISDSIDGSDDVESDSSGRSISSDAVENLIKDHSELSEEEPQTDSKDSILHYLNIKKNKFDYQCYVKLVRYENDISIDKSKYSKSPNKDIDRLCNLDTINRKRKSICGSDNEKKTVRRKRKKKSSSSLSQELSDSDSDLEIVKPKPGNAELSMELDSKLDEFLMNKFLDLKSSTENASSTLESGNESSSKRKEENRTKIKGTKRQLKFDEMEKSRASWKNDVLLRGKLSPRSNRRSITSSDSHSDEERKKKKLSKYEHDTDFNMSSDSEQGPSRRQISAPKNNSSGVSDSSSTSDDDSDESVKSNTAPKCDVNSPKGRRNIRDLMSEESLQISTQLATKEEKARIQRLEERQKIRETLSQCFSGTQTQGSAGSQEEPDVEPLILDIDQNTSIKVHPKLVKRLKPHQRVGIQFMWDSCFESVSQLKIDKGSGCILAHCMGLGKTFQVVTLVHTLFSHSKETNVQRVLVVCPLSTVDNWKNEVNISFKGMPGEKFSVATISDRKQKSEKYKIVRRWGQSSKSMLIVGYECFELLINEHKLDQGSSVVKRDVLDALVNPGPDLVICDEGHLLRNKNALKTVALNRIKTRRRIVLTGTPLQNNLMEYYHMVNFVKPNLLGICEEFKRNFVNPITNGQYEDSTKEDITLMKAQTHVLHRYLRKTIQRCEASVLKQYLPKLTDYAVFVQLHPMQVQLYNKFLEIAVRTDLKKGFLSDFKTLQYIGTHPYLLILADKMHGKKRKENDVIMNEEENNRALSRIGWWKSEISDEVAEKIELGNKMLLFRSILEECGKLEDKVIVFSQSLAELDMIEHFLQSDGTNTAWKRKRDYHRLDGTVPSEDRATICDLFNDVNNKTLRLLLMSTKVGGLGLNLTAANRVIIMTVNWNPSYDSQSIFRTYRFGQSKPVYVYRLVSLDTMEQKVYQRQITKLAIAHRVVDKHQIKRHYRSIDLKELYSCRPDSDLTRPTPMVPNDRVLAKIILEFPFVHKYHEHQSLLANEPEEDLDEEEKKAAWEAFQLHNKKRNEIPPNPPVTQDLAIAGPTFSQAYALAKPNLNNVPTLVVDDILGNSSANCVNPSLASTIGHLPQKEPPITVTIEDSPEKDVQRDPPIPNTVRNLDLENQTNRSDHPPVLYRDPKTLSVNKGLNKDKMLPANGVRTVPSTVTPSYVVTSELAPTGIAPSKNQYSRYVSPLGSGSKIRKLIKKGLNPNVAKRMKLNQAIPCYEIADEDDDAQSNTRPILKECTANTMQQNHKNNAQSNDIITLD